MFINKNPAPFIVLMLLLFAFTSCLYMPKKWAIKQFEKETGLNESGYKIKWMKGRGDELCIITTITPAAKKKLEKKFTFITNEEFLAKTTNNEFLAKTGYSARNQAFISYPTFEPYNLDSIRNDCVYYLHTYTNESKTIATNYTVFILSKKTNEFIFCEMFAE